MRTSALRVEGLVKHYGPVEALRGIDLDVARGEIFGFLGPNGAGKSTTVRIALDLIRPTAGRVQILGHDAQRDSVQARRQVGYLQSDPELPAGVTAREAFRYFEDVRGERVDRAYLDSLVERLDLDLTRTVSALSRGNRQKVGIVLALMHRAPLIILDEPTTGLDPLVQETVESVLREVAEDGRTVFFSSHILAEVEAICSRAAIVRQGLIVDVFDLAEQRRLAPRQVDVEFAVPPAGGAFEGLAPSVSVVRADGARWSFETRYGIDALVKALARHDIADLSVRQTTLEELFMDYYRPEDGAEDGTEDAAVEPAGDAR
ncbi:MAG: ABC transporter ATP-binding protein [Dehalococcoidia bacterium]